MNRMLGGALATALAITGLVALPGAATATTTDSGTVLVTPGSGLLDTSETRSMGHNEFLELGLHVYTDDTTSEAKAAGYLLQQEPLSTIAAAPEPVLDWTLDPGMSAIPGKQLVVDFDATDGPDGILVGEPVYGNEWWLNNTAEEWVQDGAPHEGGGFGSPWHGTLAEWSAAFGSAQNVAVGYSLGSGIHGGGVINSMTYGTTTYVFQLGFGPCEALIDEVMQTYTLTADCSTFSTLHVPDGWTVDGDDHTITAVEDATHPNFPGPVILSATGTDDAPATMHLADLTIATQFSGANSGGQLAGIKYDRAGGSLTNVVVDGVTHGNGVQEGHALWVRNRTAAGSSDVPEATITVTSSTFTRYQKSGVIFDGNTAFTMTDSTVGRSTDGAGNPLSVLAANALQISRGAHGTLDGNAIGLNDYNPTPPPGDGSDATGILLYNAGAVTIERNIVSGTNADVGMDMYNDGTGSFTSTVTASCNLFQRDVQDGDYDPYGIAIAQWDDGSVPVDLSVSDSTFIGWNHDTALLDGAPPALEIQPGAENVQTGACAPTAPVATATGGLGVIDVSWTPSTAPAYAPVSGYAVTLTPGDGSPVQTQDLAADATSTQFTGLASGVGYEVSVVAVNASGTSEASVVVLPGTTVSITPSDLVIKYKKPVDIEGTLTSTDLGADLAGRTVTIQRYDGGDWVDLGTATTASDGSFVLTTKPKKNTTYRAVYAGGSELGSISDPTFVYVSVKVTLAVSDSSVALGEKVKFSGKVSPRHKNKPVTLEMKDGSTWVAVDTVSLNKKSRYNVKWTADIVGSTTFRVSMPGDGDHAPGTSRKLAIDVS